MYAQSLALEVSVSNIVLFNDTSLTAWIIWNDGLETIWK